MKAHALNYRQISGDSELKRERWEDPALTAGKHILEFDFKYDGLGTRTLAFGNLSGLGKEGTGVLKVDGQAAAGYPPWRDRVLAISGSRGTL